MTEEPRLLQHAKATVQQQMSHLDGPDDDILPVLLTLGPHGMGVMPCHEFLEDDGRKDELATLIMAVLTVARAREAAMVTTAYMLSMQEPQRRTIRLPIRENPDRVEVVMIMHCSVNEDHVCTAEVMRNPDKPPTLGEWKSANHSERGAGRFGDAMHLGMDMANNMPQEMVDIVEDGWREGKQANLIHRFVDVVRERAEKSARLSGMN